MIGRSPSKERSDDDEREPDWECEQERHEHGFAEPPRPMVGAARGVATPGRHHRRPFDLRTGGTPQMTAWSRPPWMREREPRKLEPILRRRPAPRRGPLAHIESTATARGGLALGTRRSASDRDSTRSCCSARRSRTTFAATRSRWGGMKIFAVACVALAIVVGAMDASAGAASPGPTVAPRVWAVAGGAPGDGAGARLCVHRSRCAVGDLATDVRFGSSRFTGTVVHVDPAGRLYLSQRGSDGSAPLVRVGLDGRIDRIYELRDPPDAVAIGPHGVVYYTIADEDDRVVWRWDPTTKTSARFAGRLSGAGAACGQPGVALATCPIDDGTAARASRCSASAVWPSTLEGGC